MNKNSARSVKTIGAYLSRAAGEAARPQRERDQQSVKKKKPKERRKETSQIAQSLAATLQRLQKVLSTLALGAIILGAITVTISEDKTLKRKNVCTEFDGRMKSVIRSSAALRLGTVVGQVQTTLEEHDQNLCSDAAQKPENTREKNESRAVGPTCCACVPDLHYVYRCWNCESRGLSFSCPNIVVRQVGTP